MSQTILDEPPSIFDSRKITEIYDEICDVYTKFPQPWVIGYSGGKDSTAVLQLVWKALERLPVEQRQKPVYVIASDTKVETPVIVDFIDTTLRLIGEAAVETGMPFFPHKVMPTLDDSFWVNLIGRGYPAPTTRFRWRTDRMKITPANRFIEQKVTQHGEVVVVLGVRKAESATRAQLMSTYQVKDHILRRHASLRGAYVYAPVADFTTNDVWTYLLQVPSPWGGSNQELKRLYRNAASGECPLVIDTSTPTCGNSRFGCWVCTVAQKDSSMEALVDNGQEWLLPLLEFREFLGETVDPAKKHQYRNIRGRDGRVIYKKDGTLAARTYKLEASEEMLRRLLNTEKLLRDKGPDKEARLIDDDELLEIRRLWRTERQDWDDAVPEIVRAASGRTLDWPVDDDGGFDGEQKALLSGICHEYDVPLELVTRLLEVEKQSAGMARRAGIHKEIGAVLKQEWRSEEELLAVGALNAPTGKSRSSAFVQLDMFGDGHATA
jgi:DNA sulfur modification protein DndC